MIVRPQDVRKMAPEDVTKKFNEISAELIRQKGKKTAGGAPENPGRLKALRRAVARILTIQREMGVDAIIEEAKAKKAAKPAVKPKSKVENPMMKPAHSVEKLAPHKEAAKPATKKTEGKK